MIGRQIEVGFVFEFDIVHSKTSAVDSIKLSVPEYFCGWLYFVRKRVINGFPGMLDVQLSWFAVGACSVVVEYAISDVACFLNFSYEISGTD